MGGAGLWPTLPSASPRPHAPHCTVFLPGPEGPPPPPGRAFLWAAKGPPEPDLKENDPPGESGLRTRPHPRAQCYPGA